MPRLPDTYEGYDKAVRRRTFASDAYTGKARDKAEANARLMTDDPDDLAARRGSALVGGAMADNMGVYLYRRRQGEHIENYVERVKVTRYPMHMNALVADFVGAVEEVEADAEREWGVLGDPDEDSTKMNVLWHDADGAGANWPTQLSEALIELLVAHEQWYYVEPAAEDGDLPRFKLLDFESVVNYRYQEGRLVDLLYTEMVDTRESIWDEPKKEKHYIHYDLNGWTRYRLDENEEELEIIDTSTWRPPVMGRDGKPRLPMGRARIALNYHVGYKVAQGNVDLYNLWSDIRNLIRVANHPILKLEDGTKEQFDESKSSLKRGARVFWGKWGYSAPDAANFSAGYEVFKEEVRDFYVSALQQYNDAPKVRTAREVEENAKGRNAFLSLLSTAVEEMENDVLFLASQIIAPRQRTRWTEASVRRSRDFRPINEQDRAEQLMQIAFGPNAVPLDQETLTDAALRIAELISLAVPEERRPRVEQAVARFLQNKGGVQGELASRRQAVIQRLTGEAA